MASGKSVSGELRRRVWDFRARGGRLYRLAIDHDMTPSQLSATINGARRADDDERIIKIGATLGLTAAECFEHDDDSAVAS
jgi:hypothetical protein